MCKTTIVLGVICPAFLVALVARADVSGEIARIEALPRTKRLAEYETLADRRTLSDADRTEVIQAFAKHAAKLSPVYGSSMHKIDVKRWQLMLEYAHQRDPQDQDVAFALIQLLIDQTKYAEASPYSKAFAKAHPDNHFAKAWSQYCEFKMGSASATRLPVFPLHFCVITRNPQAHERATLQQCQNEIEIFNRSFVTLEGKALVKFALKGFSSFADVRDSRCELLAFGDSMQPYSNDTVTTAFNACQDPKVRDQGAINVYIFDSHSAKAGFADPTSHGIRDSNHPFLLIDWQRLGGNLQNAEPHEMGHCFGLGHVGVGGGDYYALRLDGTPGVWFLACDAGTVQRYIDSLEEYGGQSLKRYPDERETYERLENLYQRKVRREIDEVEFEKQWQEMITPQ